MSMLRKRIGEFYLVERIGSEGTSEVYLGLNPRRREKRAFKLLGKRNSTWSADYGRFLREVDTIRGLQHPGILRVLESGILDDCYYYSMEFMPKGSLARRLQQRRVPLNWALECFASVCEAMAYAHDLGVIHRHLKPANILFNSAGAPVVSDFGVARMLDIEKTSLAKSGEILGAIPYLAPEQRFSSRNVNRRADVYALGAILYEMLMGFPPLGKSTWPPDALPGSPSSLQTVLGKCLAPEPENRFDSAASLLAALKGELASLDSGPPAPRPLYGRAPSDEAVDTPPVKSDRIESWFGVLRTGTTRERLIVVREMVETLTPAEAKTIVKLYAEEGDRVRWGLIRVLGELRIESATPLILNDLNSPFHTECAIEALGKIGGDEAYNPLYRFVVEHPDSILLALVPLARTGKQRAIPVLRRYLEQEMALVRQGAVRALAEIPAPESLYVLKGHLCIERDDSVRSALLQAVYSLNAVLLPSISPAVQPQPYYARLLKA